MLRSPRLNGHSILNVVAEIEHRLTGQSPSPRLAPELRGSIPDASTYVLILFDGLGDHQLIHQAAPSLAAARIGAVDAMFPTQTTVNLATLATATPSSQHGLIAYQLWLEEVGQVVNTLKWNTLWGKPIDIDAASFLPSPNLWERLSTGHVEPITVQPGGFVDSPLSRLLYRGCRLEPAWTVDEIVDATVQLAAVERRLIFSYFPNIDVAAHMTGQSSEDYGAALATAGSIWSRIESRLPEGVVMMGLADHGHVDYSPAQKVTLNLDGYVVYGNPRTLFLRGPEPESLARDLPATWVPWAQVAPLLGSGPIHPAVAGRSPDGVLVADDGFVILPPTMDRRMIGYHGGSTEAEMSVPLLVGYRGS